MEDLQDDVLREISRHLPCVADRDDAADTCKKLRAALMQPLPDPPLPRQLPWLLHPSAQSTRARCLFCDTKDCAINHKLTATHGARYFGSYNGAWLFLASDQVRRHAVVNIRAPRPERTVRHLPDMLATRLHHGLRDLVFLAATLSSPPDHHNCIGAGIIMPWKLVAGQRQVAFWHMGDPVAMPLDADNMCQPSLEVEDVLYHDGAFRFLTQGGHIRVCTPVFNEGGELEKISDSVCFFQEGDWHRQPVMGLYLVNSRGVLHMVVRYGSHFAGRLPTANFKVYKLVDRDDANRVKYTWRELETLDGQVLFVGRGCSRSFEVASYMEIGLEEGMYFTDDYSFYDPMMMFRDVSDRKYPCSDNGRWSWSTSGTPKIQQCFPMQEPSVHSPPIWLLP